MAETEAPLLRAARWCAFASAVAVLFSIALCHIFLALALAGLFLSGAKLRFPPIKLPLALFLGGTLVSLLFSGDIAGGLPQVRKMYVFGTLLVTYSLLTGLSWMRRLMYAWFAAAAVVAGRGVFQFWEKYQRAGELGHSFYTYYVQARITGAMSHWMTFGGQEMIAILLLGAFLLFGGLERRRAALLTGAGVLMAAALVLNLTRSIWVAVAGAGVYLLWRWRKWTVLAVPVLAGAMIAVGPEAVRTRATSIVKPQKEVDSNQHRIACYRTGIEMIRRHPLLGVGPEQVGRKFNEYAPKDLFPLPEGWYGHLHNIYIHYAAERGIPTMLMLMWLLARILFDFGRGLVRGGNARGEARALLEGSVAVVLAILVSGVFELNLGDSEVLTMFLVTVSAGYVALEESPVDAAHVA